MDGILIDKIMSKKEFSQIPRSDVEKVFSLFERRETSLEDKVKLSRDLLRKIYSVFTSDKLLNKSILNKKTGDEILKKHISTKERYDFYKELYEKIINQFKQKEIHIIDLGAGINGLSYRFFPKGKNIFYTGVEAVGQLVEVANLFFEKEKINDRAKMYHESLFQIDRVKELIKKEGKSKIIFLFKVVDSLEMIERDYSKKFLTEITPLVDIVIASFATRSLISGKKFGVKRYWFENFLKEHFEIVDDFEMGNERYISFRKR